MNVKELDYSLPKDRIAQYPPDQREACRLLVLDKDTGEINHSTFRRLDQWLEEGDLLVINDTRVIKARLFARKETGGRVDILLCEPADEQGRPLRGIGTEQMAAANTWRCLIKCRGRITEGMRLFFEDTAVGEVIGAREGKWVLKIHGVKNVIGWLEDSGTVPLPPYINREPTHLDSARYQTIFARKEGSIAAPTAALHFSEGMVKRLTEKGVRIGTLTLHVGSGTFLPIRSDKVEEHRMEPEYLEVGEKLCSLHRETRSAGGRVVAVGTTTVRAMEAAVDDAGDLQPFIGETSLFIYPGYRFKAIDGMITNFHLPRSTPLMMVAALAGVDKVMRAYQLAIEKGYSFFSYGDAMLIL